MHLVVAIIPKTNFHGVKGWSLTVFVALFLYLLLQHFVSSPQEIRY